MVDGRSATVEGGHSLSGAAVRATDSPGAGGDGAAGLVAEGETRCGLHPPLIAGTMISLQSLLRFWC